MKKVNIKKPGVKLPRVAKRVEKRSNVELGKLKKVDMTQLERK